MSTINDDEQINSQTPRLILELDKTTNEPLVEVSSKLVEQLKPHQSEGVKFLWNNVFESVDAIKKKKHNGNGCILAHCMGLGKTLQVISFIHTVLNYDKITNIKTCLVLCPINAALNWTNEFEYWLKDVEPPIDHYQLTTVKPNLRVSHLNYWYENGGVVIMGYEMYRRLASGINMKNKKSKAEAYKCLVDPGPDIVGNYLQLFLNSYL
jgi:transcriptional regulator ATRX